MVRLLYIILFFSYHSFFAMEVNVSELAEKETPEEFGNRLKNQVDNFKIATVGYLTSWADFNALYDAIKIQDGRIIRLELWEGLKINTPAESKLLIKHPFAMWFYERWLWSNVAYYWQGEPFHDKERFFGLKACANKRFVLAFAKAEAATTCIYIIDTQTMHSAKVLLKNVDQTNSDEIIEGGAVSCSGDKIAVNDWNKVYLSKKRTDGTWKQFSLLNNLKDEVTKKENEVAWRIRRIDFNKQATEIGVYGWREGINENKRTKDETQFFVLPIDNQSKES